LSFSLADAQAALDFKVEAKTYGKVIIAVG